MIALRQGPIALVTNDAMAALRPRVQVAGSARAQQARSLGPNDAEAALHYFAIDCVRGTSTPIGSMGSSLVLSTLGGRRGYWLPFGLLARWPSGSPLVRNLARAEFPFRSAVLTDACSAALRAGIARRCSLELRPDPTDARIRRTWRRGKWNVILLIFGEWGKKARATPEHRRA